MSKQTNRSDTSQARRELIITSAVECFIEKGFHQTSIRDIAGHAGISLGNLYNHFKGKDALIAEIASLDAQELDEIKQSLSQTASPSQRLEKFVVTYLNYCSRPENIALSAEIVAEGLRNPAIAAGFLENRNQLASWLSRLISSSGQANASDNNMANAIIDLIEGQAMLAALQQKKPAKRQIQHLLDIIIKLVALDE